MRALSIALSTPNGDSQPLYLAAGYLLEFGFPTFAWLGDENQDQTVPHFAKFGVSRAFHTLMRVQKALIG
jgi:hypothetical protein